MKLIQKRKSIFQRSTADEKSLFKGTLWNLFGNGISKILMLLSSVLVASFLGSETFGKWGVIRSTSAMFTIFLGFGVGVSALKYVAQFHLNEKARTGNILGIAIVFALVFGIMLTAIFYFMSDFISIDVIKDSSLIVPLKLSSFFLFFIALNGVFSGGLAGFGNFKSIAMGNLISGLLGIPLIIYFCYSFNLNGLVLGYIFYYFLIFVFLLYSFIKEIRKHHIKLHLKNSKENLSIIFNHNFPAILSGGVGGFVIWGVNAYVARLNGGFSVIGINNAAKIVQNSLMELSAQLDIPILSYISKTTQSKRLDLINLFSPIVLVTLLIVPIIYFPELITWMFKDSSYISPDFPLIVSITMITCFIMIYKRGIGRLTITKNLLWFGLIENLIWAVAIWSLINFFVPAHGALGYSFSFMLSYVLDILIITPFFYKRGLIPKIVVNSKEIIFWWILCFAGGFLIFFNIDIYIRIPLFVLGYSGAILISRIIYKKIALA